MKKTDKEIKDKIAELEKIKNNLVQIMVTTYSQNTVIQTWEDKREMDLRIEQLQWVLK